MLGLIGISAGTALGSAFVDAAKPAPTSLPATADRRCHQTTRGSAGGVETTASRYPARAGGAAESSHLITPSDKQALDDNEQQQNEVRERLANYRWQSVYFAWPTWKG